MLLDRDSVDVGERAIDAHEVQVAIVKSEADRRRTIDCLQFIELSVRPLLAIAQRLLGPLASGDVGAERLERNDVAGVVEKAVEVTEIPAHLPVGPGAA